MKKIVTILGARPQFIKAAALSREFKKNDGIDELIVHTGQHYDYKMSDIFFSELEIPEPDFQMSTGGKRHGEMTGQQIIEIESYLLDSQPDVVLVYGDTNSTMAGALAAAKLQIPVAHVEAGLRSFNRQMPEEINRVVADHISDILFAPSDAAMDNLKNESLGSRSYLVGDIMNDAIKYYSLIASKQSNIANNIGFDYKKYSLITFHRQENTCSKTILTNFVNSLIELACEDNLVFPVHPGTKLKLEEFDLWELTASNVKCIEPVGYLDMIALIKGSNLVVTDSGGIQKEGYFCGTRCIVVRNETEWTELIDTEYNYLLPVNRLQELSSVFKAMVSKEVNITPEIYGNGNTAAQISEILERL